MAKIGVTELAAELRQGKIRPLYVVCGEESHLVRTSLENIEKTVLKGSSTDMARRVFEGQGISAGEFADGVRAMPLLGGRELMIIRDAAKLSKQMQDGICLYLEKPLDTSIVVLTSENLDGRSRLMQTVSKSTKAAIVECRPLYPNQIPAWVNTEIQRSGKKISKEAANYLSDVVGNNLGQLTQAIERVALYVGNEPLVNLKDVESAIAETTQRSVFELTDAIGAKNIKRALNVLANLTGYGTPPVLILNMIARHFRILVKAREIDSRLAKTETATYLGVNPYFAKNYMEQSKNFSALELRKSFGVLSRADREIKSSRIPKEQVLERLLMKLCVRV